MSGLTEKTVFDDLRRRYSDKRYTQTTLVTHRGTVIAFAMDEDRRISYAVLDLANQQENEIDSAAWPQNPTQLIFPNEVEQVGYAIAGATPVPFVRKGSRLEAEPGTLRQEEVDTFLSTTARLSAQASFQVMSDNKHIFLFRQTVSSSHSDNLYKLKNGASSANAFRPESAFVLSNGAKVAIVDSTLVCDTFILSGKSLLLSRECRFRRSRHRTEPANQSDALGTTDMEGNPFYRPTKELAFVKNVHGGCFHIVQLPTMISGFRRWHIFSHNSVSNRVDCFNFEVGADGLFNLAGTQLYTSPDPDYSDAVLERAPGRCPFTQMPLIPIQNETQHAETCLMLPATGGYAEATVSSPWDAAKFTIEMFVYAENLSQPSYTGIFSCSSSARFVTSFQMDMDDDGNYRFLHHQPNAKLTLSAARSEWQHLAISYDGSTLNGLVDGVIVAHCDVASLPVRFDKYIIGANRGRSMFFKGCIDEVRVWNRARSDIEIRSDLRQRLIGNEPGLVTYFRLDEGTGSKAYDQCDTAIIARLRENACWKVSDAPLGENAGMRRTSFTIDGRLVTGGMCAKHFYQQEKVATGYDGSRKPMKKHSRVMLVMSTTNLSQDNVALATLDFAVSREGRLAQIPDVVLLPVLTKSERSTNLPRVRTLEEEVRTITDEIETLEGEIQELHVLEDLLPALEKRHAELQKIIENARRDMNGPRGERLWYYCKMKIAAAEKDIRNLAPKLEKSRYAKPVISSKQNSLIQKQASVTKKTREINQLTGGQLAPMEVPMTCIHYDTSGLSILGGILNFANSEHTPQILDSALGRLGLYYRSSEPDGDLMVTYYETVVSRARFFISPDLTLTASLTGSAGPDTVTISDGDSPKTCTVTVTENSRNITETWTGLPRKPSKLADIMNGVVARPAQVTVAVIPPVYDVSRRSCLVSAIVSKPNRDTAVSNGPATVTEGLDSIWISDAPGRTYFFDYNVQQMKLPSSNLGQTVPDTALAVEAWINIDERNAGCARIVHHVSGDAAYAMAIVPTAATASFSGQQ